VERCGLKGSPTQVVRTFTPPVRGQAQVVEGNEQQQAENLAKIIQEVLYGKD
jgi:electron transfer flavoprotein alpha/beta subunit